nr:glycosyltransferase [Arthrobacter sp. SLBN-53]
MSSLYPLTGLESATLSLIESLRSTYDVRVVALANEAPPDSQGLTSIIDEQWGSTVTGWKRLVTLWRAFRHRADVNSVVILSGAWTAIPLLLALSRNACRGALIWEHSFGDEQAKSSRNLRVLRFIARTLYARAHATVAVSESLRRDLIAYGFSEPIAVIPNIVRNLNRQDTQHVISGRLLAVGSLTKNKNLGLAIRALSLLPSSYTLDIVGDGAQRHELEGLVRELGITDRVWFSGYVEDPAEYFSRAEIMVHPSLGETYGLVLFEAAQFGKPVVAVNQSVMPEVVPALVPGVLTAPEPKCFADAIVRLSQRPITPEEHASAHLRRQQAVQNIATDWQQLINSASESRAHPR